jgi:hypothetical protein
MDGYVREMGGYVREMGGLVGIAPACYDSSLSSNPDISQKIQNGRHKQRNGQHTLASQKIYLENIIFSSLSSTTM